MKKTSILLASSIMILAVIVAIVGVTAAWFGNQYTYNGVVNVSSEDPKNNAIIVQGSASVDSSGENPVLTPAKILPGLILSDVDGSEQYDKINVREENPSVLDSVATKVTVTFDFVYNGAPSNTDGITSKMQIELVSVTLANPLVTETFLKNSYSPVSLFNSSMVNTPNASSSNPISNIISFLLRYVTSESSFGYFA